MSVTGCREKQYPTRTKLSVLLHFEQQNYQRISRIKRVAEKIIFVEKLSVFVPGGETVEIFCRNYFSDASQEKHEHPNLNKQHRETARNESCDGEKLW
jgi:hypothetical protein